MKIINLEGKKEFNITVEVESILNKIKTLYDKYEDNLYVNYGTSPEFNEDDFKYISKDVYIKNVEMFEKDFLSYVTEDNLKDIIKNWNRKKNGSFNRRNVKELASCNNCIVIHEWHNTWIYYTVKVVAVDDYNLRFEFYKKTDTPG